MQSILAAPEPSASPIGSVFQPADHNMAARPGCSPPVAKAGPEAGSASGLVYSQTSGTPNPQTQAQRLILVDRPATRLKKMRSAIITGARLHNVQPKGFRKERAAFITFTYRKEVEWEANHLASAMRHIRQWFKRRGHKMRSVWVMELHKDGRPHYHALVMLPRGLTIPKPDKQGWWPHGSTKIEYARNPVGYIAKYASKGTQGNCKFPDGARIYGVSGLVGDALLEARWWKLPAWAREHSTPSDGLRRRASGGGILNPSTGELLLTPWRVKFSGGHVYIYRVDDADIERAKEVENKLAGMSI